MTGQYHLENLCIDGRIMVISLREAGLEDADWIHLVQDMDW
jgi:hypothetical protein